MLDVPLDISVPLQRAARAEREKIAGLISRIEERLDAIDRERDKLRGELARLKERSRVLQQIIDPETTGDDEQRKEVVLRGARLRLEASRILYEKRGAHTSIYYRDWYGLLQDAGFVVLGKRPLAAFLTAVGRSPIVRRSEAEVPGTYLIDPGRASDLAAELAEVEAELADLDLVLAGEKDPSPSLREHRVRLLAAQRRLQAQVAEAEAVVGPIEALSPESAPRRVA